MTATTAAILPTTNPDDLIRRFCAYEIVHVRRSLSDATKRAERLTRVLNDTDCGPTALFVTDPDRVAMHFHGGRKRSGRRTRTARGMSEAIEDFREWYTIMSNRGEV